MANVLKTVHKDEVRDTDGNVTTPEHEYSVLMDIDEDETFDYTTENSVAALPFAEAQAMKKDELVEYVSRPLNPTPQEGTEDA